MQPCTVLMLQRSPFDNPHTTPAMVTESARYTFEIGGNTYEVREAEYSGVLFEIVTTLVFDRLADRASYILETGESELTGSGGSHFDLLSVSLYRHLKVHRCRGPSYEGLGSECQSFKLHSVSDALVAVAFFLKGGDAVPHFIVGSPDRDLLLALDRGRRTQLTLDDPALVSAFSRLVEHTG